MLTFGHRAEMSGSAASWTSAPGSDSGRRGCFQAARRRLVGNRFTGAPPLKRFRGQEKPLSDAQQTTLRTARAPGLRRQKGAGIGPNASPPSIDREQHPVKQARWDALGQRQGIDIEERANRAGTRTSSPASTCAEIFLSSTVTFVRHALR